MEKRDFKTGLVEEREAKDTLEKIGMPSLNSASIFTCVERKGNLLGGGHPVPIKPIIQLIRTFHPK